MLSEQAKSSIEYIFIKSVKANFALNEGDRCDVNVTTAVKAGEPLGKNILVLTISSFMFRLLTIFYINENAATRTYFDTSATNQTFEESIAELGNLCCGNMNRDLSHYFPHLGMSIPFTLSSQCITFLDELKPEMLSNYMITLNDSIQVRAALCMCVYEPIHFTVNTAVVEEQTGELELF